MATIQDVAKRAGVGAATVSRVLNGTGYASEQTREKVLRSARELHYVPSGLGQQLLSRKTMTVGVVVADMDNPFFSSFVEALEEFLHERGYKTMLCCTKGQREKEEGFLNFLSQRMVDGLITSSHLLDASVYRSIERPIVSIDRVLSPTTPMVCSDHISGGRLAAQVMMEAGCRQVVQLHDSEADILGGVTSMGVQDAAIEDYPFAMRHREFARCLKEAGIPCHSCYKEWNTFGIQRQQHWVDELFRRWPDVDGILTVDVLAVRCLRVASRRSRRLGCPMPKIVAYDGTSLSELCTPSLDVIVQPVEEIAREAVRLLMREIRGEEYAQRQVILPVQLRRGEQ